MLLTELHSRKSSRFTRDIALNVLSSTPARVCEVGGTATWLARSSRFTKTKPQRMADTSLPICHRDSRCTCCVTLRSRSRSNCAHRQASRQAVISPDVIRRIAKLKVDLQCRVSDHVQQHRFGRHQNPNNTGSTIRRVHTGTSLREPDH